MRRVRLMVAVAVVTLGGVWLPAAAGTTPAKPPVGAGYRVARADAASGRLQLTVPKLTCRAHETSELGAVVENVLRHRGGDGYAASVSFKCIDGVASYHSFLRCGNDGGAGPKPRPGNRVALSYNRGSASVEVDRSDTGVGYGCARTSVRPANEPEVAFLVRTRSHPPSSLRSLKVQVMVAGHKLSRAHPKRQSQPVPFRRQLHAGPIASDGKTFTVGLRNQ